jgi:hypothetical protein
MRSLPIVIPRPEKVSHRADHSGGLMWTKIRFSRFQFFCLSAIKLEDPRLGAAF